MVRTRRVSNSADEDPNQRTRRKNDTSHGENSESTSTGSGVNEGKKPSYHCNYCNKDLTEKIRIKCATCPDFDLCVECFSVGAEVTPHSNNHPYRVMDNMAFCLLCPDWNADEEILLIEGLEMYGLDKWSEVAEHVSTKTKGQCINHYTTFYLKSPSYPLPDMSHVSGKNREKLITMGELHCKEMKGFQVTGEYMTGKESLFPQSNVKIDKLRREAPRGNSPSNLTADGDFGESEPSVGCSSSNASKVPANCWVDRSIGEDEPSMAQFAGYNPNRDEFDPEYDNDAEQLLADMEFKETDTKIERELKLRMLKIYNSRLDERQRRKNFIKERNLLHPNPWEKNLTDEEREICNRFKVFMRFQSRGKHNELVQSVVQMHRMKKGLQLLEECKAAGMHNMPEARAYLLEKAKMASQSKGHLAGSSTRMVQRVNRPMGRVRCDSIESHGSTTDSHREKDPMRSESGHKSSYSTMRRQPITGADLLSETEKQLCCENKLLPSHFFKMQEMLMKGIFAGQISNRSDARGLFNVDPGRVDKVYDILMIKLGIDEKSSSISEFLS